MLRSQNNQKIPLPPAEEQKRVVAKLEELLPKVNAVRERLNRVKEIMKRFRQSVLAAAFPVGSDNTPGDDYDPSVKWKSAKLIEVVESIQIGPFGSLLHRSDYVTGGIPVINPTNIRDGKIESCPDVSVRPSKKSELERYVLQEGDVIVGRRGEMGRCAVIGKDEAGWICGTGSLFIRPGTELLPEFLQHQLSSPHSIASLEKASVGSTMTNLNQRIFYEMTITVAPIEEQHQIVRRLKELFNLSDMIEGRIEVEISRAEKMDQAILAKAFRGELVSTEAGLGSQEQRG
jgi:type I restriction enzyme S subunit